MMSDGSTKYMAELKSGDCFWRPPMGPRGVVLGRIKIEQRPMVKIVGEPSTKRGKMLIHLMFLCNKRKQSALFQNFPAPPESTFARTTWSSGGKDTTQGTLEFRFKEASRSDRSAVLGKGQAHGACSLLHAAALGYGASMALDLGITVRLLDKPSKRTVEDDDGVLDALLQSWIRAGHPLLTDTVRGLALGCQISHSKKQGLKSSAATCIAALERWAMRPMSILQTTSWWPWLLRHKWLGRFIDGVH